MSKSTLLRGAIILSIAGIITKLFSAIYRVPYQNMAGDIGFYVYQQVYPFYGMAIIFATIGFPVVISKYVAEFRQKNVTKLQEFIAISFISLQLAGLVLFMSLYYGAPFIASIMHDRELVLPIRAISFIFLFVPFVATIRGYYQGFGDMKPTATTQVVEQVIRITVILTFTYLFVSNNFSDYVVGTGAAFGSIIGVFFAGILLYLLSRKDINYRQFLKHSTKYKQYIHTVKTLYLHGFAICLSAMALILFQAIDAFTMVPLLKGSGVLIEDAKIMKGVFDRGQPLIQLGTVIATSIALPLIPMLATASLQNNWEVLRKKAELALRTSFLIGLAAATGLAIIIDQANLMLFKDTKGSDVLFILSITIFFSSIATTTSAILQGAGHIGVTARHVSIGLIVKFGLSLLLIPIFLTKGAAIATVSGFLTIVLLNIRAIRKRIGLCLPSRRKLLLIFIAAIVLAIVAFGWQSFIKNLSVLELNMRFTSALIALSTACIGVFIYFGMILFFGVYSKQELSALRIEKKFPKLKGIRKKG